jgi:hypothetical protein
MCEWGHVGAEAGEFVDDMSGRWMAARGETHVKSYYSDELMDRSLTQCPAGRG